MTTPPSGPRVLALGDSLTTGHGLPPGASFAARLGALLDQRRPGARVRDAGVSGDTTAGGLARLPGLLTGPAPDLAIVALGANDLLRGLPSSATRANLDAILALLGECGVPALVATFEPPPFLRAIAGPYARIPAEVAAKHGARVAPFFPAGVLGRAGLVLADGIHPNARAIRLVARAFLPAVLAALDGETVRYGSSSEASP